jgi:hypothetical protein
VLRWSPSFAAIRNLCLIMSTFNGLMAEFPDIRGLSNGNTQLHSY